MPTSTIGYSSRSSTLAQPWKSTGRGCARRRESHIPRPPWWRRFQELGGERVVTGSDAHRVEQFLFGLPEVYQAIGRAGFRELSFRRGGDRVAVELPADLVSALVGAGDPGDARPGDHRPDDLVEGADA